MKKFWYFVAEVVTNNWIVTYSGYVSHADGFFPIAAAKLQTIDYATGIDVTDIPASYGSIDKKFFLKDTFITNQIEVAEKEFDTWKVTMKF